MAFASTSPGADLAIALAVASAHSGRALETDGKPLACFGELGLTGEVRYVAHADRRVAEARKFGLDRVLGPPSGDETIAGLTAVSNLAGCPCRRKAVRFETALPSSCGREGSRQVRPQGA